MAVVQKLNNTVHKVGLNFVNWCLLVVLVGEVNPIVILFSSKNWFQHTWSVRKVSDRIFLCEHLMDYNLARLHELTLNLSAHA